MGCKLYIRRPGPNGQEEERLAEILSIRDKPVNPYASRQVKSEEDAQRPEDRLEFFVHWDQFNKRLDEWVPGSRLVLTRDLEWPRPKATPAPKKAAAPKKTPAKKSQQSLLKRAATASALAVGKAEPGTPTPGTPGPSTPASARASPSPAPSVAGQKRKTLHDEDEEEDGKNERHDGWP